MDAEGSTVPTMTADTFDKSTIADLVAKYGSSSATAWLEFERYKIWRPTVNIPDSEFIPVQGYMTTDDWIFAWGNPLVSSPAALAPTARAFIKFVEEQNLHPVWACVDRDLEEILGSEKHEWRTVSCIYEDFVDPAHIVELTSPEAKGQEGQHAVKDLRKNLMRAEKSNVLIEEVKSDQWTSEEKKAVEDGIEEWKAQRSGIQIASTTLQPWLDQEHRRYWVARREAKIVGFLILTPIQSNSWQIKNAVSFPDAPKGTSESLIYGALKDLHTESGSTSSNPDSGPAAIGNNPRFATPNQASDSETSSISLEPPSSNDNASGVISPVSESDVSGMPTPIGSLPTDEYWGLDDDNRVMVTFGISAASKLEPVHNLGGWKVKVLSKTYKKVASSAKLINRGEFRRKFDSGQKPMYVCYPEDGFGLDGANTLFKLLRK